VLSCDTPSRTDDECRTTLLCAIANSAVDSVRLTGYAEVSLLCLKGWSPMPDKKSQQKAKRTLAAKLNAGLKSAQGTTTNLNAVMGTKKSTIRKVRVAN
jgi:hypothetical protein